MHSLHNGVKDTSYLKDEEWGADHLLPEIEKQAEHNYDSTRSHYLNKNINIAYENNRL